MSIRLARLPARGLAMLAVAATVGCVHTPPASSTTRARPFDRRLVLNQHALTLHIVPPVGGVAPLLIYATGDGGWRGKDVASFRQLAKWGHPLVGFSAPEYLKHLPAGESTTTPGRLARDYAAIIKTSEDALKLPASTPVILVGVSRGAGLSVVAAGNRAVQSEIGGVVAVGLTKEEEYVRWFRRTTRGAPRARAAVMLQVYEYLPRLSMPVAVVQSTRDEYLRADDARRLFGTDTNRRRFRSIDARNHSFAGSRNEMYQALKESIDWVDELIAGGPS